MVSADDPLETVMASTLPKPSAHQESPWDESVVAVVEEAELEAARRDPRVRAFLDEADAYLADLERQGRNRCILRSDGWPARHERMLP